MGYDRPTASVTGADGWRWNERRNERENTDSTDQCGSGSRCRSKRGRREPASRAEVRELETELERTKRRYQTVLEQYERILSERNRELAEERTDRGRGRSVTEVVRIRLQEAIDR